MIRNLIFDIGNVLTDYRWEGFLRDKGFDDPMIHRIAAASVKNPAWSEMDRGVWTDEELMESFVKADPEIEEELYRAFEDVHGIVAPRAYAIPWLRKFKENGYKVWYLSNFSRKAEAECADALTFLPYMDGGILSYRERLIKPDPAIYKLLLERFGLRAEESVFVDDMPVNVEAARALGLYGIVFQSKEQVEEELRELGVKI